MIKVVEFLINDIFKISTPKHKFYFKVFYYNFFKFIAILFISYITKTLFITLGINVAFILLRLFNSGIHAKKNYQCWIVTLLVFGIIPLIVKYLTINLIWLFPILIILNILYAPNDTKKHPITKHRLLYKITSTLIITIYLIISLYVDNLVVINCLISGTIISIVSILPLTYRIFKEPSYNYRSL